MKKAIFTGLLISFFALTGCGPDLYDLANSKLTPPDLPSSMQIDALFLQKTISNNDILPRLPIVQNTTNSLQFLITNNGNGPLTITEADLDSDYFELSLSLPFTIDPGDEQQFTIDITPTDTTEYSSLIRLHSSDPDNPQFEFTLNAVSYHGLIYVSSSASDSGTGTATNPYKSLSTAISNSDNNDSILIDSGTYDGSFAIDKPLNLIGNYRYNGAGWIMVPENETDGRPVLRNNSATADDSTVHITASPLSSEILLTSLNIYTPNASANASTVLIDSSTETSGAITIRNCNISNPDGYNSTDSSAAISLTNGTQSGTVSITDSFIRGGDGNINSWGIRFFADALVLSGFNFIIQRNNIEVGITSSSNEKNAGIEVSSPYSGSNYINNTNIQIDSNERICGSTQNFNNTDNGIFIFPQKNAEFNNFSLLIQDNGLISGGTNHNSNNATKYGINFTTYNILTTTGSEIIIRNNGMIRAHGPGSTEQPYKGVAVYLYRSAGTGEIPVTVYGNHIKAEANTTAESINCLSFNNFDCVNNIITSETFTTASSRCLFFNGSKVNIYNNLVYVLGESGGTAITDDNTNPVSVSIMNNIIMVNNADYPCITSSRTTNRHIQYNYLWSGSEYFYYVTSPNTQYSNATGIINLNVLTGCEGNFTVSSPIFDSNWRLTSNTVNNPLKLHGVMIPGLVSDISGNPRPGSDGAYAVGPYEY